MTLEHFIKNNELSPEGIDPKACLTQLLGDMELGLKGEGNIPMIPSYLSPDVRPVFGEPCCVLDAGGTNLRVAKAVFEVDGSCRFSDAVKTAMPGTKGELTAAEFYSRLGGFVRDTGCVDRIGFCFSYNVSIRRDLDGVLDAWCKEIRVPDAPGKPVGASLRQAVGEPCGPVRVLNDSTAALLGAHWVDPEITVALILGTGINTCYLERCANIPKVPGDLRADAMIVSTEVGEFRGIPCNPFEKALIDSTDDPALAQGEKQCAGGYLGDVIHLAWKGGVEEGILPPIFAQAVTLPQISDYLAGSEAVFPQCDEAKVIAETMIHRAARIAAILTAGGVVRSCGRSGHCKIAVEGSQFRRLTGFGSCFTQELEQLLGNYGITCALVEVENSCLVGAALAAFAQGM